jgi:hypothetical protein
MFIIIILLDLSIVQMLLFKAFRKLVLFHLQVNGGETNPYLLGPQVCLRMEVELPSKTLWLYTKITQTILKVKQNNKKFCHITVKHV